MTFKAMLEGELQPLGPDHFHTWAVENPTDFYRLAARLIPAVKELSGPERGPIEHRSVREYTSEELCRILEK